MPLQLPKLVAECPYAAPEWHRCGTDNWNWKWTRWVWVKFSMRFFISVFLGKFSTPVEVYRWKIQNSSQKVMSKLNGLWWRGIRMSKSVSIWNNYWTKTVTMNEDVNRNLKEFILEVIAAYIYEYCKHCCL